MHMNVSKAVNTDIHVIAKQCFGFEIIFLKKLDTVHISHQKIHNSSIRQWGGNKETV